VSDDDATAHPGEIIAAELTERGWTQKHLADLTGLTPKHICRIISGRSGIGTHAANLIGPALDVPARWLLRTQADWDLAHHRTRSKV